MARYRSKRHAHTPTTTRSQTLPTQNANHVTHFNKCSARPQRRGAAKYALATASLALTSALITAAGCSNLQDECIVDSDCPNSNDQELVCAWSLCIPANELWCQDGVCQNLCGADEPLHSPWGSPCGENLSWQCQNGELVCTDGQATSICNNGVQDALETGIDCGRNCGPCTAIIADTDPNSAATLEAIRGETIAFPIPGRPRDPSKTLVLRNESETLRLVGGAIEWRPTSRDLERDTLSLEFGADTLENTTVEIPVNVREWRVEKVASGPWHSCALLESGKIRCFGYTEGETSELQPGAASNATGHANPRSTAHPRPAGVLGDLPLPGQARDVCTGDTHSCALIDNAVHCWGENGWGQLGVSPDETLRVALASNAVQTPFDDEVRAIYCGGANTCALTHDGDLWCWGRQWKNVPDEDHGTPDDPYAYTPCSVESPTDELWFGPRQASVHNVVDVSVASSHVCALTSLNNLQCWGANCGYELGITARPSADSETTMRFQLSSHRDAIAMSTGSGLTCSLHDKLIQCSGRGSASHFEHDGVSWREFGVRNRDFPLDFDATNISVSPELLCAWNDTTMRCFGHDEAWTRLWDRSFSSDDQRFLLPAETLSPDVRVMHGGQGHLFGITTEGTLVARLTQRWETLAAVAGLAKRTLSTEWAPVELTNFAPRPTNPPPAIYPGMSYYWALAFADDGDEIRFEDVSLPEWLRLNGNVIEGRAPTSVSATTTIQFIATDGLSTFHEFTAIPRN